MDWNVLLGSVSLPAVILVAATTLILLISDDWRICLASLAVQYSAVFLLVLRFWSFEMATTKLVAGWIASAILGMAIANLPFWNEKANSPPKLTFPGSQKLFSSSLSGKSGVLSGKLVAVFSASLVWLMVFTYADQMLFFFPGIGLNASIASLLLIGMGLLQLGFSSRPLPTILGLLTTLSGFEILYASVESSALLAGLLAVVNLGIALAGAYLLSASIMEETE